MPTLRLARLEDAPAMLDLQRRAFAEEGRRVGTLEDGQAIPPLAEPLGAIEDHIREHTAFVAWRGERIVGAVRGVLTDRVCIVRALVVDAECRGAGLGSSLLAALEAAVAGAERFDLTTNMIMERNVPFYERHGYRITRIDRHGERVALAQMSKPAARKAAAS